MSNTLVDAMHGVTVGGKVMQRGDIIRHFKWETLTDEEKRQNKYLYCIKDIAEHTETGEKLVIYQALYAPFKTYARPFVMFCSAVDRNKYPNIKQQFRFEKYNLPKSDNT